MFDHGKLVIFFIVTVTCHAYLMSSLLPNPANTMRSATDAALKVPVVESTTDVVGKSISDILDLLKLALKGNIPNLLGDKKYKDNADYIETQFNKGSSYNDIKLEFQELANKYGYPTQRHKVKTDDGYILTMFRIPRNGSAVFLMHGLLSSADDFVVAGRECALGFLLADEGYDVWMGNARGNKHSRHHIKLHPSNADFWDFSWHEIGYYDLPAMIDYVLQQTGKKSLRYIGHSQGSTSFFVMASERPEYNKKIALMVALSPVAYMSNITSPIVRLLSDNKELVYGTLNLIGAYEFLPETVFMKALQQLLCGAGITAKILCSNLLFLISGFDYDQLNVTQLPVIYGHIPAGSSSKQLNHYAQSYASGEFRLYDYGCSENHKKYGSSFPPDYKLSNIVTNITLFYSDADWLSSTKDVYTLYNKLPNAKLYQIPYHPFNHVDYIWAKDLKILVFEKLRELLNIC